jgi:hypothetical protein
LNDFVQNNSIQTIIEFGCGDGAQIQPARYPEYVGVDIARTSVGRCSSAFAGDSGKRFYRADALPKDIDSFDFPLSLDVIYHLVESSVFYKYMRRLFSNLRHYGVIDSKLERVLANRFPFDPNDSDETSHSDFYFFVSSPST